MRFAIRCAFSREVVFGLLADADHDPWQVPEAWRRLQPKHVPSDASTLRYGDYAGYLLGILNLEYPKTKQPRENLPG